MKKYILLFICLLNFFGFILVSQNKEYVRFYYDNNVISSEGYLEDGKPNYYWISYYMNGKKRSEGNRKNFLLDSTWIFYNEYGDTIEIINYKEGKKHGLCLIYEWTYNNDGSKKGGLVAREIYIDDKKEGLAYYYKDGKLYKTVTYKNGKKWGLSKVYDTIGNVIEVSEYVNDFLVSRENINRKDEKGLKQGVWKEFHPNGKVKWEACYNNDTLIGYFKEFDASGKLIRKIRFEKGEPIVEEIQEDILIPVEEYYENGAIKLEGLKKNNKFIGILKEYSIDGSIINSKVFDDEGNLIMEGLITKDGKRYGKWYEYYNSGKIKAEGLYKNNEKEGEWIYYFENGKIEQKGFFKNGKFSGIWTFYDSIGNLIKEEEYFNGKLNGEYKEFNENHELIVYGKYEDGVKVGFWTYKIGDIIEEGKYLENEKHGEWILKFADTGNVFEVINFYNGIVDGKYKEYYPNGKIRVEGYYDMGKKSKKWYYFTSDGMIFLTLKFKDDKLIKINGKKIKLPKGSFE